MNCKTLSALCLFLAMTAGGVLADDPAQVIVKVDIPGIVNFSKLEGSSGFGGSLVGFGGATEPSAMKDLKDQGFSSVINLRLESEEGVDLQSSQSAASDLGLQYIYLPFDVSVAASDTIDRFLQVVGDQANQPVFIHCNSATRVAALWMIGRVVRDGWSVEAAGEEAKAIAAKPSDAIEFSTRYLASLEPAKY